MDKWQSVSSSYSFFVDSFLLTDFRYEGEWVDDFIHGKGVLQKVEGGKYRGEFWNGLRGGVGSEVNLLPDLYQFNNPVGVWKYIRCDISLSNGNEAQRRWILYLYWSDIVFSSLHLTNRTISKGILSW